MQGFSQLSLAVRDLISVSEGETPDGVDTDAVVETLLSSNEISLDQIGDLKMSEDFDCRLGEMLDYFERSNSIAMLRSANRARSSVKEDPHAQIELVTLAAGGMIGVLVVGLVLAARISKLRYGKLNVEFFKGVPSEVEGIVRASLPKLDSDLTDLVKKADENS